MSWYGLGCWLLWAALLAQTEAALTPSRIEPGDWPQWRGPDRTGRSAETGLLPEWPRGGPPLLWKVTTLGGGYSAPSVAGGRIFGMSYRNDDEGVWCLDAADGHELWWTRIAAANREVPVPQGSRSSPTVDGEHLYAVGVSGDVVCLETATGKIRWRRHLVADFGGRRPDFGFAESPLVDGEKVVVTPGGTRVGLAALDRLSGATVWEARIPEEDKATYASVIRAEVNGEAQYIQFLSGGVVGVAAADGRFLWRYDRPGGASAICSTPLYQDGCVFAAAAYDRGGGLARLTRTGQGWKAEEVYFSKHMKNQHGGMVVVDGYLYGCDEPGVLVCLEFRTGRVMWQDRRPGKGSLLYADGRLYYHNQTGPMILIEANPRRYVERGRFDPPLRSDQEAWTHPVLAHGRLYLRDQGVLLCYDVQRPGKAQTGGPSHHSLHP